VLLLYFIEDCVSASNNLRATGLHASLWRRRGQCNAVDERVGGGVDTEWMLKMVEEDV